MSTSFKDYGREQSIFFNRALFMALLTVMGLGAIVMRLVQLQVDEHEHFTTLSRDNRIKLVPIPPNRGLIFDSRGVLLAENRPSFSLEVIPEKVEDLEQALEELRQLLAITPQDLERFWRQKRQSRRFDSLTLRLDLNEEELARFVVNGHRFPGFSVQARLIRHYPLGDLTSHVIGYVGRISETELGVIDQAEYRGTQFIGKTGLEKSYESILHGKVGRQQVEVNAKGRAMRVVESHAPASGQDLHLYLDIGLQQEALDALGDSKGAVVAIDPRTGGVLALVSKPVFDPNPFVRGISTEDYSRLLKDKDKPLYNRALRGQYPPGSTVKPFMALASLAMGAATYNKRTYCPGFYILPNQEHRYRCWRKTGHGTVNMDQAIVQSCDVFFYDLAHDMGVDRINDFLTQFGFGRYTGVDLPNEVTGLLPSKAWKEKTYRQPWFPGETLSMGIGQGYFLASPLQLAVGTSVLANHGFYRPPRLVKTLDDEPLPAAPGTKPVQYGGKGVDRTFWDQIVGSMINVIEEERGTAHRIKSSNYLIAGKTGTAQVFTVRQNETYNEKNVQDDLKDHALFVAFAPADNPRIAVAVLVENGGHGGSTAAPIARRLIDRHLLGG